MTQRIRDLCGFTSALSQELQAVEDALNDGPRKHLNFLTLAEVLLNYDPIALQS